MRFLVVSKEHALPERLFLICSDCGFGARFRVRIALLCLAADERKLRASI